MSKKTKPKLPCQKCMELDVTCCKDAFILFSPIEAYKVVSSFDITSINAVMRVIPEIDQFVFGLKDRNLTEPQTQCIFLENGTRKCAIYKNRPYVCRHYGTVVLPCAFEGLPDEQVEKLVEFNDKDTVQKILMEASLSTTEKVFKRFIRSTAENSMGKVTEAEKAYLINHMEK